MAQKAALSIISLQLFIHPIAMLKEQTKCMLVMQCSQTNYDLSSQEQTFPTISNITNSHSHRWHLASHDPYVKTKIWIDKKCCSTKSCKLDSCKHLISPTNLNAHHVTSIPQNTPQNRKINIEMLFYDHKWQIYATYNTIDAVYLQNTCWILHLGLQWLLSSYKQSSHERWVPRNSISTQWFLDCS